MRNLRTLIVVALLAVAVGVGMLATINHASGQGAVAAKPTAATKAVAVLAPTKGNKASGTIIFDVTPTGVHVHGTIAGLEPKTVHGFHVHEFGDVTSDDGMSVGTHYNPENMQHGGPMATMHHAGDLGNVTADDKGEGKVDVMTTAFSLDGKNPVLGRGLVLHALEDNLTTSPNPGGRIAVGVIGLAKGQ